VGNIYELYSILSENSLKEDERIEGDFYRTSDVDIIGYYGEVSDRGIESKKLGNAMKQLVVFIQDQLTNQSRITYLIPHIIHYYILYLHPYYDFNGRMARMLSYWYTLKCPFIVEKLPIFSEAINYNRKTKAQYYRAIENSRADGNDLTFFFKMLFDLGERFVTTYMSLYAIDQRSSKNRMSLTDNELSAIKTILLNLKDEDYFTWEQYHFMSKEQYSKQYTLKLLNGLVDKQVLDLNKRGKINYYRMISKG
jgi:Fic family protein